MIDTNGMTALLLVVTRKCMQRPPTVSTTLKKYNLSVFTSRDILCRSWFAVLRRCVCVVRRCDLHLIYNVVVVLDIRVRNPPGRFYVDSLGMDIFAPTDTNSLKSTQNPPTA